MDRNPKILLIDDDEDDRILTHDLLREAFGTEPDLHWVADWEEGLKSVVGGGYDIFLVDYRLGERDGLDLIREAAALGCSAPSILLTGQDSRDVDLSAGEAGAADYLVKGELTPPLLERAIRYAIARQQFLKEQIEANALLKKKNYRLSQLYNTAHQFVDNVSHEFRTPLTVIREFISILQDGLAGEVNETQHEYLGIAIERVDDLNLMVNDMLDISRLEAGLLGLTREECRVEDIVERVRPTLERKALSRKIVLDFVIEDGLPGAFCDAEKIGRVIINLVVNAIKFCREGGHATLWVRQGADRSEIAFGVTDDGPGIAPEHLKQIFSRFETLGADSSSSTKGFGLGLNIVRQLVQLHLGEVSVESERGQGSTFIFTVPAFEPSSIFQRYLDRLRQQEGDSWNVTLIPIHIGPPCDLEHVTEVTAFLHNQVRVSDILFQGRSGRWLLVAATGQHDLGPLLGRFERALRDANRNRVGDPLPQIALEPAGTWCPSDQTHELAGRFMALFGQMTGDADNPPRLAATAVDPAKDDGIRTETHAGTHRARGAV